MYYCSMYSKELLKGTIDTIILNLLANNDKMYGYEISQRVKEQTDGKILLKDGSLYPIKTMQQVIFNEYKLGFNS